MVAQMKEQNDEADIERMFEVFDKDQNNFVSSGELKLVSWFCAKGINMWDVFVNHERWRYLISFGKYKCSSRSTPKIRGTTYRMFLTVQYQKAEHS